MLRPKSQLPLVLDYEDPDLLQRRDEPIERYVSRPAERDHQFAEIAPNRPSQERVSGERLDRRADRSGGGNRRPRVAIGKEAQRSLEVREGTGGIDYLRHGFGRAILLPRAKRSIHA